MKANIKSLSLCLLGALILTAIPFSTIHATQTVVSTGHEDNTKTAWWLVRGKNHAIPGINTKLPYKLEDYNAIYVGDTTRNVIYLTFDEGYEKGFTPQILDTLQKNNVKATFFVTSPYVKNNPDLIKRMYAEGHIVGNHSNTHPSMPSVANNIDKFNNEILDVSTRYKEITSTDMPHFFRPPMGEYSQKTLALTKRLGYTTVFWSFAYHDWDIDKQPSLDFAKKMMTENLHPGAIYLLHAVSKTNTTVLDDFIKEAIKAGYSFELLPQ